jgi:hypothetical protein
MADKRAPGQIRDAILAYMRNTTKPCTVAEIRRAVSKSLGSEVAASSIRSYLGGNVGGWFRRIERGTYELRRGRL